MADKEPAKSEDRNADMKEVKTSGDIVLGNWSEASRIENTTEAEEKARKEFDRKQAKEK